VITQWAMTNHMLFRLYYTTGTQPVFPGYTTHLPVSMANVCDDNLNRVAYTRSRSGIPSAFPIYIAETLAFIQWRMQTLAD